jgi:uncharacterized membrane protein (UPF0127 family)
MRFPDFRPLALVAMLALGACADQPPMAAKAAIPVSVVAAPRPMPTAPRGFEPLQVVTPKGSFDFAVELAETDAKRERGLMFRESLAPDRGMLFDFQTPRVVAFWMKNTLIPLDIIYIAQDGRVISIARNATPKSLVPLPSGGAALGVLELAGGRAEEIGLLPGDRIRHRILGND